MENITITPEMLAAIAGAVLSLLFSYVPGLNTKYAELDDESKQLFMLLLLLFVTIALFFVGCAGWISTGITCDQKGALELVWMFILAIISNQGVHRISPPAKAVKAIKAAKVEQPGP